MGDPSKHKLIAGVLCLNFMNTINGHHTDHSNEYITNYTDLIVWIRHTGLFNEKELQQIFEENHIKPKDSEGFETIIERYRACLSLWELDALAKRAAGSTLSTSDPEDVDRLAAHFEQHVEQGRCPDCLELYEALLTTSKAASRATEDAVTTPPPT